MMDEATVEIERTHLQGLCHHDSRKDRRSFRKLSYELVQELLCGNLELERVAAVLDEGVEELKERREKSD